MKTLKTLAAFAMMATVATAAQQENRFFEMRIYHAAEGKMEDLQARFRNHTLKLFERHGIENIGYWVPMTNSGNKLYFVLAYPNREAREASWKRFMADADWQKAFQESERNGKLVNKAESIFLAPTDFSPRVKPEVSATPRVFELRTYTASPGKLDNLLARFRDHTVKLFARHGITQLGYWVPTEKKDGAGETLTYMMAHKSRDAADASFKAFRADPDWVKARADSEVNGPLTVPNGVVSVFLVPTDFSPMK